MNDLTVQTYDELAKLPYAQRKAILKERHDWLKRVRKQGKVENRRIECKIYRRTKRFCKTHQVLHSKTPECPYCKAEKEKK